MLTLRTPLDVRALPDGKHWELLKELVIDVGEIDGKDLIRIPKGFITDFGSIPPPFNLVVNPQGKAKPWFVLHDYLYQTQERSQLVVDAMLNEGMTSSEINMFQRFCVYRGLRLGGFITWNKYKRGLKERELKITP